MSWCFLKSAEVPTPLSHRNAENSEEANAATSQCQRWLVRPVAGGSGGSGGSGGGAGGGPQPASTPVT